MRICHEHCPRPGDGLITMAVVAVVPVALIMGAVAVLERVLPWLLAATGLAVAASAGAGVLLYRKHGRVATGIHVALQPSKADVLAALTEARVAAIGRAVHPQLEPARVVPGVVAARRDEPVRRRR